MSNRRLTSHTALKAGMASALLGLAVLPGAAFAQSATATATQNQNGTLDQRVMATLQQCQNISTNCASLSKDAVGILVFPSVIKADLIIGGAGGKGALIENGKITGYYTIGVASAGLQAGIDKASQVYVFRTQEALSKLKDGSEWRVGATSGVTVASADANARAVSGDIHAFIFDSKGLHAGVSLELFDVWKTGQTRPSA
jgi:lipid-binding SYLF domain-containing protein